MIKSYSNSGISALMVIPSFAPIVGGAEKQLAGLAKSLTSINCEATVLTRLLPGTVKREDIFGVPVVRLTTTRYRVFFLLNLFYYIFMNRRKYDVIHVHTLNSPAIVSAFIGKLINVPVIVKVTRSGKGSQISRYYKTIIGRLLFSILNVFVTRFIAITQDVKKELLALGVKEKNIKQIPNGVTIQKTKPINIENQSGFVYVYVGRLIKRKRVDWLINAFSKLHLTGNDRLVIVGSGAEMDSLKILTSNLKLDEHVDFMGELRHEKVINILTASSVFVLPSDSEGMSNALLEGMACNNTVVAANIPSNCELIEDEVNGLLFSSQDELTECLIKAKKLGDLSNNIAENALRDIKEKYSFQAIAEHYKELYNYLLLHNSF